MMEMELTQERKSRIADITRRDLAEGFGDKWTWEALPAVERAEGAINDFLNTGLRTRRAPATHVPFRTR